MNNYTVFVWNNVLSSLSIQGAEAETPEEAKALVKTQIRSFCEVKKVVNSEEYELVRKSEQRQNKRATLNDIYHALK